MSIDFDKLKAGMRRPMEKQAFKGNIPDGYERESEDTVPDFELDDDGEEYRGIGTDGILAATEKLLAINRGLTEPDERDSMKFQKVFRTHSLLRERIKMDSGKLARTAMYRAAKSKNLSGLNSGAFDGYIDSVMVGNALTSPLEEINPMQLAENARRITAMGPGGLGSAESITEEAQSVHPSQFGFIDNSAGPECFIDDDRFVTSVLTSDGWKRIKTITKDDKLACRLHNRMEFHYPSRVIHYDAVDKNLGDYIYHFATGSIEFAVTKDHRIVYTDIHDPGNFQKATAEEFAALVNETEPGTLSIPGEGTSFGVNPLFVKLIPAYQLRENRVLHVHCATVPGNMLFVSVNGGPGFWSGNSEKAGIDVRIANGVKIGSNGRLYQKFTRPDGKKVWLSPEDLDGKTIRLPD